MKALIFLSFFVAACHIDKPKEIVVPYNTTDTILDVDPGAIKIQKKPGTDSFHFEVDAQKKDTLIIKNQKQ